MRGGARQNPDDPQRRSVVLATIVVGLVMVTVLAFQQLRHHDFVLYDDTLYVTENARVQRGITLENLWWGLTTMDAGYWHPLTWWSHMLDCELFGLHAGGHHATSIALHVVAVVLCFHAFHTMTGALWKSAFVAALFAVHPLHVESVAYIAERKDVLSGVFWMLTLATYARYARAPSRGRYAAVIVAFALGLMAKPMAVTLPFVLLLLDCWPLGRLTIPLDGRVVRTLVLEKLPLLALAAVTSLVTFVTASEVGAIAELTAVPFGARVTNALLGYVTYLSKMVWPARLACFYPYRQTFDPTVVVVAGSALLAISIVALALARRWPYVAVGWLWYLGTLVPVIGLVQVGQHAMADRYTYLPLVGPFFAVTWAVSDLCARARSGRAIASALAGLVVLLCVVKTRAEVAHWQDSISLFEHAIAVTEGNHLAHNNLGLAYRKAGRLDESRAQLEAAIALVPDYGSAHFNLGETLLQARDVSGAATELQRAVELMPNDAETHMQLGGALYELGQLDAAVLHERRALELRPDLAGARVHLADALAERGELDAAIEQYQAALALDSGNADAHYNFGTTLARRRRMDEAIEHFARAIALAPDHALAHNNLGRAYASQGRVADAIVQYSEAIRLAPDLVPAVANRAEAYEQLGDGVRAAQDRERLRGLTSRSAP